MHIDIDVSREVELIIREKEGEKKEGEEKEGTKKISSELPSAARELDNTLDKLGDDLNRLKNKMHESGLDSEFGKIKGEIRSKLSSFLSY
ncbi:MAG: hypothetical protein CO140_00500 [Candidatus Moranbacteria bacterium CG_4_9_14_3_um_filter_40_7]|nr:MAG: hypothetical protein COX31_01840 [Candidatus Moranbacteria bacterium CG23_combo_of_CG06-09_8_20_14_all_40_16]PIU80855.1 MAG: hypothetical protein COS71_01395 [Candidatus Moranbacteria bacterium CG06_land_8_20_14_3_00_40_12]PJA88147.1 MAG: hypothetical protein CO140_00500 [Candidatus Moranbacteria bacterium CG_4_9_14_3_um_filter_40_7]